MSKHLKTSEPTSATRGENTVKIRYSLFLGLVASIFSSDIIVRIAFFSYPLLDADASAAPSWWALHPLIFVCPAMIPFYVLTFLGIFIAFLIVREFLPWSWRYFPTALAGSYAALILHFGFFGAGSEMFFSPTLAAASLLSGAMIYFVAWALLRMFS